MQRLSVAVAAVLAVTLFGCARQKPVGRAPFSADERDVVQRVAADYRVDSAYFIDSVAYIVFQDSTLTPAASDSGTWMFGPKTTVAENDGCPAEKVLGRRIARALWTSLGKPAWLSEVRVEVLGPLVSDSLDSMRKVQHGMYYPRFQLTGPWVGDTTGAPK